MIIGFTGSLGSGKDTAADYLKKKGFAYYSLSDILREECHKRNLEKNRDNLIKIGNELRTKFGPDFLSKRILERIEKDKVDKAVIVSLRNPKEVEIFKKRGDFILLNIAAPLTIRFERIRKRAGDRDKVSFEKFKVQEDMEMISQDPNRQQLRAVMEMADYIIDNAGSLEDLYAQIEEKIGQKISHDN